MGEPPPYTQIPENGHVSLMHGSPLKPDEHTSVLNNSTSRHFLNSSINSTDNMLSEPTDAFHPTRTSSPAVATAPPEELFPPYLESTSVHEPFPPHLPPLTRLTSHEEQSLAVNEQSNNTSHLSPLTRLTSYQEQSPINTEQSNSTVTPSLPPPLNRLQPPADNEHSTASSAEHRHKRRRRKRKRGHSWHGERVAPAPMQQDASDHH